MQKLKQTRPLLPIAQRGFTIVELLVVIVVIAILAAITIVSFNGITRSAVEASMKSDLRNAASVLGVDQIRNNRYPNDAASANDGKGLASSGDNEISYRGSSSEYCVAITSPKSGKSFKITSETGSIEEGDCSLGLPTQQIAKITPGDVDAGDTFGSAIAVSGTTAVISSPNDDDRATDAGAIYVYIYSGGSWVQQAKVTANDGAAGDQLGAKSVAIDGDTIIAGTAKHNGSRGAAYIFTRSGSVWTQQAKITGDSTLADSQFAGTVAISGNTVVMNSPAEAESRGTIYMYVRSGSVWTRQAKLTLAGPPYTMSNLGYSLAISGDTILAGAPGEETYKGAVYRFSRTGSVWTQQERIPLNNSVQGNMGGISMALSGDTLVVGSYTGAYSFKNVGGSWAPSGDTETIQNALFGFSVAIDSKAIYVSEPGSDGFRGAVHIYTKSGNNLVRQYTLAPSDLAPVNTFGSAIAVSEDMLFVGAGAQNSERGTVYIFKP